jgi:hypothetical protein
MEKNMHAIILKNTKTIVQDCDFFVLTSNELTMINNQ